MLSYPDKNGLTFERYRTRLPAMAADFPRPVRPKDPDLLSQLHREWTWCHVCGASLRVARVLDLHHLFGGWHGRGDLRACLMTLCRVDHADAKTRRLPLGALLWCRYRAEPETVDWPEMAIQYTRFLPDLIPQTGEMLALYHANRGAEKQRYNRPSAHG